MANLLIGKSWIDQCFMIKRYFDLEFQKDIIYGLGQASVIKKQKFLVNMKEKLHKPSNELYVIIVRDYSVLIYGNYVFNSQKTHVVYWLKSNFNYIFRHIFRLSATIEFQHNAKLLKK